MTRALAVAALCGAFALAGCAVPMQTIDASRAACAAYGFQAGSNEFAHCVQTEQHRHTLHIYAGGGGGIPRAPALPPLPGAPPPVRVPEIVMPQMAQPAQPQPQLLVPAGGGAFMALP